jgi:hypothetical protein
MPLVFSVFPAVSKARQVVKKTHPAVTAKNDIPFLRICRKLYHGHQPPVHKKASLSFAGEGRF